MDNLNINNSGFAALQTAKIPPALGNISSVEKTREVAEKFEAFFLGQMLQPMFASTEPAEPFGGGHGEKVWKSLMVDEVGKSMAKNGGIGIADMIQRDLLRLQEVR
jgi:flagellar protein FlgJ